MNAVADAILSTTSDAHVRAAMLMGAQLESGMNANAVGDNGKSFGPFQIYTVAHPNVSPSQAQNPGWAAAFMLPAYQAGVSRVAPALWQSNPAQAAAQAAFNAERPKVMYPSSRVAAAWPIVQSAMAGQTVGPTTGTGGGAGGGVVQAQASDPLGISSSVDNAVEGFRKGIMILANMSFFFSAVAVGGILTLVGLVLIFRETSMGNATGKIKSAYRVVSPARAIKKVA